MALINGLTAIGDAIREKNGTTELIPFLDMPQAIRDISGGGVTYVSVEYNDDDTITLTDTDGIEHIMSCVYDDDKLISITYDDKSIPIGYEGAEMVSVGDTVVNVSNARTTTSQLTAEAITTFSMNTEAEVEKNA